MIISNIVDKPLCPMSTSDYPNAIHIQKNRFLDAVYDRLDKDEDNEFTNEKEAKLYNYLAHERFSDFMNLFVGGSGGVIDGRYQTARYNFYQCMVCGYTIPAFVEELKR